MHPKYPLTPEQETKVRESVDYVKKLHVEEFMNVSRYTAHRNLGATHPPRLSPTREPAGVLDRLAEQLREGREGLSESEPRAFGEGGVRGDV